MAETQVVLIGGVSGAGKTTLARAVAYRLDAAWLTIDDLSAGLRAVTTPESHPGIHVMTRAVTGLRSVDYFTECASDRLIADAKLQHEATWPAVEATIRYRAAGGPSIVIDGWYFHPRMVATLELTNVHPFWLVIDRATLEQRERQTDMFARSPDPERMLKNFLGRSYWYNDLVCRQATDLGMPILHQDGTIPVNAMCDEVVARLGGGN